MTIALAARAPKLNPALPVYHLHEDNACPSCGSGHWWVGRITAECAGCGSALPLAEYRRGPVFVLRRAA